MASDYVKIYHSILRSHAARGITLSAVAALSAKAARGLEASPAADRLDALEQAIMPAGEGSTRAKQDRGAERTLS
jgi:hypothetical protein